jgi:cell division protein FtsL
MASRSASARQAAMPEPWWSASPFPSQIPSVPRRDRSTTVPRPRRSTPPGTGDRAPKTPPARPRRTQPEPAPKLVRRRRPTTRARVRIVRRSAHSLAFPVAFGVMLLVFVVIAPLGVNVAAWRANWTITKLEQQQEALVSQEASLRAKVAQLSSRQRVKQAAEKMGMTPVKPGYLRLENGLLAQATKPSGDSLP